MVNAAISRMNSDDIEAQEIVSLSQPGSEYPLVLVMRRLHQNAFPHSIEADDVRFIVLISDCGKPKSLSVDFLMQVFKLTNREAQLAALLAEGTGLREIRTQMNITENTVKKHLAQVFQKTHVNTQAALIRLLYMASI